MIKPLYTSPFAWISELTGIILNTIKKLSPGKIFSAFVCGNPIYMILKDLGKLDYEE